MRVNTFVYFQATAEEAPEMAETMVPFDAAHTDSPSIVLLHPDTSVLVTGDATCDAPYHAITAVNGPNHP